MKLGDGIWAVLFMLWLFMLQLQDHSVFLAPFLLGVSRHLILFYTATYLYCSLLIKRPTLQSEELANILSNEQPTACTTGYDVRY